MKKKNENGITLISLVITVLILMTISSVLVGSALNGMRLQELKKMQNDIQLLDDMVSSYYSKYGSLPFYKINNNVNVDTSYIFSTTFADSQKNVNDGDVYNIIDLNAFDGLTLNYGNDFYNYIDKTSSTMGTDIYIINDQSHQIYYLRGISVDGYTYYTNEFEKTNVN